MNGVFKSVGTTVGTADLSWAIQAVGDFNQDGKPDLVWRRNNGELGIWLMNGLAYSGWAVPGYVPDLNWQIRGAADFNQDGQTDLLWRNYATGDNQIWLMKGAAKDGFVPLNRVADLGWEPIVSTPVLYNPTYGYGLVNAAAAVAKAIGQPIFADVAPTGITANDMINAPEVWAKGYTGQGVIVAVVDTGVDINHPALKDNIWVNTREVPNNGIDDDGNGYIDDVNGWDFIGNDNKPIDDAYDGGHGTHLAGTIAAKDLGAGVKGVAYAAKIMPVRVDAPGYTPQQYHTALASGIRYAANNGAKVINVSRGIAPEFRESPSDILLIKNAIIYATQKGCIVVSAAGNYGLSIPEYPARFALSDGIAVGVVNDDRKINSLSNKAGFDSKMLYVVSPGVNVISTKRGGGYISDSGTSMAAAYVSGIIALMLSADRNLNPDKIRSILYETSIPLI
jgi:subtilisin family serine protease